MKYQRYNKGHMKETELDELELKVDKLIVALDQLKLAKVALTKKNNILSNENVALLDKKKKAANSIRSLIQQLQDDLPCQV